MNNIKLSRISILLLFSLLVLAPVKSFADKAQINNIEKENYTIQNVQTTTDTPITGKPTTTVYQMQQWAKSKNANQKFIDLAQTFYNISVARGIDPAVVYTQSAKETGYMKFGGVLDISYYNPCGMKNSAGGGDYDGEAHKRFKNWNDGIYAQVDHLALYAGQKNFPKFSQELYDHYIKTGSTSSANNLLNYKKNGTTTDPRHFSFLLGKATTVESLGENWAPSATYGEDIVRMMNDLYTFPRGSELVFSDNVLRYSGANRYLTAEKINSMVNNNSTIAVISSGMSFPDTLVASTLTSQKDANLYINSPNSITSELDNAITNKKITEVYLIGGNCITEHTKNRLTSQGVKINNLVGVNRYETSALLAENISDKSTILLANGEDFADALSSAPVSQQKEYPLLLTNGETLDPAVENLLKEATNVIIIGGTSSVSGKIGDDLESLGLNVRRIYGANRYETSAKITTEYYESANSVVFASGLDYPDALSGTVLSNNLSAPIFIIGGSDITNSQKNYILSKNITSGHIVGGESAISKLLESNIGKVIK
ncbi:cell wall-binding repeat-containing protein [Peptostreptococcaceae bacterium OttesenSCG-928-C18]|nr:cell wall-binding repeat-containing protein [Peptostreptococcaceae bacterium OttesenSCG-928-C18]